VEALAKSFERTPGLVLRTSLFLQGNVTKRVPEWCFFISGDPSSVDLDSYLLSGFSGCLDCEEAFAVYRSALPRRVVTSSCYVFL
jgi:hypothetical protein